MQLPEKYTCGTETSIIDELRWKYSDAEYALQPDGVADMPCSWYYHEEHMKEFSKTHPEVVFCLHCENDENYNMSDKYYKNGKQQICPAVITYPPYDETKLK